MWNTYLLDQRGHLYAVWSGNVDPVALGGSVRLSSLSSGAETGCGLGGGAQVWCWGANSEGELGNSAWFEVNDGYGYPPVAVGGWYPLP
jgi:hypothetical protein